MGKKPYKATSLKAAEREVRSLRKRIGTYLPWATKTIDDLLDDRHKLAKLACREPQFFSPLDVFDAEKIRDETMNHPRIYPQYRTKGAPDAK